MITTKTAIALSCLLAAPGIVLAVAASVSEPATYHLAEDTDALWSYAEPGEGRMPSIDIVDDIYPDESGVQFLVDGEPDDRHPGARPDGYDATGPQDDSTFHIYPKLDLVAGMKLEARWRDGAGTAHTTTWTVGESRFVHALVGEDLASWTHVEASGRVEPTITIDDSIYPNERGVQFIIDGQVYDTSKARPGGFDATGPQDGSVFHAYPRLRLSTGMQLEARWIDRSRVGRSSVYYVGSGVVDPATALPNVVTPTPEAPTTETTTPETTTPPTTTSPTTTIVVTLPPTTTDPVVVTLPPTTEPISTQPPATTVAPPTDGDVGAAVVWADVEAGSERQPTIVIDSDVYPRTGLDGDQAGVQFWLRGQIDQRCSCRPNGWDATGPQEGSSFHIYPSTTLAAGDVIEARWVDRSGVSRSSTLAVPESSTPSPVLTTTPDPVLSVSGEFPNAANTGVPGGIGLSTYTGPCTITADNTVIDAKVIGCGLRIEANNVTISRSIVNGALYGREDGSFTVTDSELVLPVGADTVICCNNFTVLRAEIVGGRRGVSCYHNCVVQDSWIHGQDIPADSNWHASGMRASQDARFIHNTVACDATDTSQGGCSANITMYGDFEPVQRVTIQANLFLASQAGYCSYGGSSSGKPYSNDARDIVFKDNVYERGPTGKCGLWGPITGFDKSAPGNIWSGNRWDDGQPLS